MKRQGDLKTFFHKHYSVSVVTSLPELVFGKAEPSLKFIGNPIGSYEDVCFEIYEKYVDRTI